MRSSPRYVSILLPFLALARATFHPVARHFPPQVLLPLVIVKDDPLRPVDALLCSRVLAWPHLFVAELRLLQRRILQFTGPQLRCIFPCKVLSVAIIVFIVCAVVNLLSIRILLHHVVDVLLAPFVRLVILLQIAHVGVSGLSTLSILLISSLDASADYSVRSTLEALAKLILALRVGITEIIRHLLHKALSILN